jgi:hypothetical protein
MHFGEHSPRTSRDPASRLFYYLMVTGSTLFKRPANLKSPPKGQSTIRREIMSVPNDILNLPKALGDGLILRRAAPADTQAVAALNARILAEENEPPQIFEAWTRDLMSGRHPTNTASDFIVVEDTRTTQIVSSACLIPQVWKYENIPFGVGRPELVVTDPAYRRRGLVRAIFGVLHALSAAQGHLVQGITGIPWFYRQFGYEYALPLAGLRTLNLTDIPGLKEGETEPFHVRPATEADIPALLPLYQRQCAGKLVTTHIDEVRWRYDLTGHSPDSLAGVRVFCVLDQNETVAGYFSTGVLSWQGRVTVWEVITAEGISLRAVLPSITRALKTNASSLTTNGEGQSVTGLRFILGEEHPAYEAFDTKLGPFQKPYAWYIRVADVPGFIRHITPVLERRLADSVMTGYSGELKMSFYQGGLRLGFERGRLSEAADWQAPDSDHSWDGAGFPPLVFLQLLFGYRSLSELHYAFPDCWADEEPALLLNALFPKRISLVYPLG